VRRDFPPHVVDARHVLSAAGAVPHGTDIRSRSIGTRPDTAVRRARTGRHLHDPAHGNPIGPMRLGASAIAALTLLLGRSTCLAVVPGAVDVGDAIVVASIGEPSTLVPILAADSASADVCSLVFNGLVKYDKNLQLVGDLAERWEVLDGGLTILFHLRQGVQWHDGVPFTAEDVRFTYEALVNPAVRTPYSGDFEQISAVEVLDPRTVKVTYHEPFAPGLASWVMGMMPKHLLEDQDLHATPFARRPTGTGPYQFRRWRSGERIELEANADYYEGAPRVRWWIYRIIPDQATAFLELQTEGVDLTGLTPLQYRRQTSSTFFDAHYRRFRYPSFGYTYLGYNLRLPMFQDPRVRQAFNHAIDKEEIVRGALLGLGRVATGPFLPGSWAYNDRVQAAPYDPARAKALLAAAGWLDHDGDGWLDKDGRPFTFTILTNKNLPRELTAQIIQRRLKEIGVLVQVRVLEWSSFLTNFIHKRRFEAVLLGWGLSQDPDLYDIWHSSKTREGEFNFVGYANLTVDRLLESARRTFVQTQRAALYHQIHRLLYEEQPYCFLYVPDALPILHARFRNVEAAPAGIQHNRIDWYVPRHEHRYTF